MFSINTLNEADAIAGQLEKQSIGDAIGSMLFVLPLFIVSIFIIRKISKESIITKMT
jgi:flagellar biogenesis protein FliO